jgi:hypothetical protein
LYKKLQKEVKNRQKVVKKCKIQLTVVDGWVGCGEIVVPRPSASALLHDRPKAKRRSWHRELQGAFSGLNRAAWLVNSTPDREREAKQQKRQRVIFPHVFDKGQSGSEMNLRSERRVMKRRVFVLERVKEKERGRKKEKKREIERERKRQTEREEGETECNRKCGRKKEKEREIDRERETDREEGGRDRV